MANLITFIYTACSIQSILGSGAEAVRQITSSSSREKEEPNDIMEDGGSQIPQTTPTQRAIPLLMQLARGIMR